MTIDSHRRLSVSALLMVLISQSDHRGDWGIYEGVTASAAPRANYGRTCAAPATGSASVSYNYRTTHVLVHGTLKQQNQYRRSYTPGK